MQCYITLETIFLAALVVVVVVGVAVVAGPGWSARRRSVG